MLIFILVKNVSRII